MEKRLIIAITLSIAAMFVFQTLQPKPQAVSPVGAPMVGGADRGLPSAIEPIRQDAAVPRQAELKEMETVIDTEKYRLKFSNIGGSLKDVYLKEYKDDASENPLTLVLDAVGDRAIFAVESDLATVPLSKAIFDLQKHEKDKLVYAYAIPGKATVIKEYIFHKTNDYIELRLSIQNVGSSVIYKDYSILGASSIQSSSTAMERRFLEIDSMIDGKLVRNSKVKGGDSFIRGIVAWTGVKDRYFCAVLKPPENESEGIVLRQIGKTILASGVRSKRTPIYQNTATTDTYVLYIGPNDTARLAALGLGLEEIINYGIFDVISKFLLKILRVFHGITHNWGAAIIMLTVIINMALFPLTRKSFMSMRKIQEVQPHIEKLRTIHKDNPQKLNKELAELYRQYKVNPFGGCLPLFLQMPIFIALYQGLMRSIELKGANFLWIKDLSRPDSVPIPFDLPMLGNEIHLLPIFMVVAMFFQQKISAKSTPISSPEQQQQQKFMLIFFPIFFGFLFYKFPSGLVLYWLTNTVLMVVEHSAMRKSPAH
ncbi:MAG: membrane protein insertase YidC [Candidatus Omnitrophota bacterium]